MKPNERLQSWLGAAKMSQAELARRCEYDRSNMHRVLVGRLKPSLTLAAKIELVTKGIISANDWAELGPWVPVSDRPQTESAAA
jgi:DNA-binding XRE family transcriptional regulator